MSSRSHFSENIKSRSRISRFLQRKAEDLFQIDFRSLALFRVAIGVILICDLWSRAQDLRAHYTDAGILPRADLIAQGSDPLTISFHLMNGTVVFQLFLFFLSAVFAIGLLLGYRTRLCTVLSWVLLVSVQNRNPMILNSGDVLFRLLLFWGLFLPLGARFSLDSNSPQPRARQLEKITSTASAGILLQVALIYFFVFFHKTGNEWWPDGSAIYYALSIEQMTTPLAHSLLAWPQTMKILTLGTYLYQLIGPFLLFSPFWTARIRLAALLGFIGMQIGFSFFLILGVFPWVCIAGLFLFIPEFAWTSFENVRVRAALSRVCRKWETHTGEKGRALIRILIQTRDRRLVQRPSRANSIFALIVIILVLWENLAETPYFALSKSEILHQLIYPLRLDQNWAMFSPSPLKIDGWYVVEGHLNNGRTANVLRPEENLSWEKPSFSSMNYENEHWQKYFMNLREPKSKLQRLLYGKYLCHTWNADSESDAVKLHDLDIFFMLKKNPAPEEAPRPIEKTIVWHHDCLRAL